MNVLNYWTFPVAYGHSAVLISTASNTSLALMEQGALPHFLSQLEVARSFSTPVVFDDAPPPKAKRSGRKGPRKSTT